MSAGPRVILLDSNAYFRLALSVRPLLAEKFGDHPLWSLMVLEDLDKEFSRNQRLRSKFSWLTDKEYIRDRGDSRYCPRGTTSKSVGQAFSYLAAQAEELMIDVSPVDLRVLAVGHARAFPVVTDDKGMQTLAAVFRIECWPTLELLHVMLNCGRIDIGKVREVVEYWDADNDLPTSLRGFRDLYRETFKEDCPI